jgi:hypothetical protein
MNKERCPNNCNKGERGKSSPTGATYLSLVDEYRNSHPGELVVEEVRDQIWRTAALVNNDKEFLKILENARLSRLNRS